MAQNNDPVWREEIEKEVEYLGEGCRNLTYFIQRAQAQGAPQELLTELYNVYCYQFEARRRLEVLQACFSPEPTYGD